MTQSPAVRDIKERLKMRSEKSTWQSSEKDTDRGDDDYINNTTHILSHQNS